ncbi:MAG: ECF transporter S component [Eubacteriales bacterium]|nr:ECF transporter S component [Eubacteriales bacterium]
MEKRKSKTYDLVMTAMMMGLILLMTFIIRIPIPATKGYIHLGDCMIFMAVLILGWKRGALAAGVGSALADLLGGYGNYAPVTLIVKAAMAAVVGLFIEAAIRKGFSDRGLRVMEIIGMVLGGAVMCAGYYVAEGFMYGNWLVPLASVPMNILQFVVGIVIASLLAAALYKTRVGSRMAYHLGQSR